MTSETAPPQPPEAAPEQPKEKVAAYLTRAVQACGKSQKEIAEQAGFARPNIISMLKSEMTQIPLAPAAKLAEAVGLEPRDLLIRGFEEYVPDIWSSVHSVLVAPLEIECKRLREELDACQRSGLSPSERSSADPA